jgi:hypothetical protein
MYKFVFENNVAKIQTTEGVDVVVQPFNIPSFGDGIPWESAEQAEEWLKQHYPGMLEGDVLPPPVEEETPDTETAGIEISVTGE